MLIGIDFDNTIVSYDRVFLSAACDRGLIPLDFPAEKQQIRDHLRASGQEEDWTELQAYVYGEYIAEADAFPGVPDFLERCVAAQLEVRIISHKTSTPYRGPNLDLRAAARRWLEDRGFFDAPKTGLAPEHVFFEATKEAKMSRIASVGCSMFIDDLPEFLCDPHFPSGVQRILFDPAGRVPPADNVAHCGSWSEISRLVLAGECDE
jgi:hypothetical protein